MTANDMNPERAALRHRSSGLPPYPRPAETCPSCGGVVTLCDGPKRRTHWRHEREDSCTFTGERWARETPEHLEAKRALCAFLSAGGELVSRATCDHCRDTVVQKVARGKYLPEVVHVPANRRKYLPEVVHVPANRRWAIFDVAEVDSAGRVLFGIEIRHKHTTDNYDGRAGVPWAEFEASDVTENLRWLGGPGAGPLILADIKWGTVCTGADVAACAARVQQREVAEEANRLAEAARVLQQERAAEAKRLAAAAADEQERLAAEERRAAEAQGWMVAEEKQREAEATEKKRRAAEAEAEEQKQLVMERKLRAAEAMAKKRRAAEIEAEEQKWLVANIETMSLAEARVVLRRFDLDPTYGPRLWLERQIRWQRAKDFGDNPSAEVRRLMDRFPAEAAFKPRE